MTDENYTVTQEDTWLGPMWVVRGKDGVRVGMASLKERAEEIAAERDKIERGA